MVALHIRQPQIIRAVMHLPTSWFKNDTGDESAVRTVSIGVISNNQAPTAIQLSNNEISEGAANNTAIGTLTTTDANNPK